MRQQFKELTFDIEKSTLRSVSYGQYDNIPWEWYICTKTGTSLTTTTMGIACMDALIQELSGYDVLFGKEPNVFVVPVPSPNREKLDIDWVRVADFFEEYKDKGYTLGKPRTCRAFGQCRSSIYGQRYSLDILTIAIPIVRDLRYPVVAHTVLRQLREYITNSDYRPLSSNRFAESLRYRDISKVIKPIIKAEVRDLAVGPGNLSQMFWSFNEFQRLKNKAKQEPAELYNIQKMGERHFIKCLERAHGSNRIEYL